LSRRHKEVMSLVSWLLTSPLFYSFNDFLRLGKAG